MADWKKKYEEEFERHRESLNQAKKIIKDLGKETIVVDALIKCFPELQVKSDEEIIDDMIETIMNETEEFPNSVISSKAEVWIPFLERCKLPNQIE